MKKTLFFSVMILISLAVCLQPVYAASKVGYINVRKIVSDSNIGKEARRDFDTLRQEKELIVQKSLLEINRLKDEINNNKDSMGTETRQEKLNTLQDMVKEHKRLVADIKEEIKEKDQELVAKILQQADTVLKKVAQKGKYTMIIKDPNAVGFLDPEVDITDEVIKELNKQ
ncbi:MAG: OmpH family outer membrane protein [Deltaproteobacteria bacterium]|nr:OmpH family outer membrane protein [Deltaproteobacteria bacterium]